MFLGSSSPHIPVPSLPAEGAAPGSPRIPHPSALTGLPSGGCALSCKDFSWCQVPWNAGDWEQVPAFGGGGRSVVAARVWLLLPGWVGLGSALAKRSLKHKELNGLRKRSGNWYSLQGLWHRLEMGLEPLGETEAELERLEGKAPAQPRGVSVVVQPLGGEGAAPSR